MLALLPKHKTILRSAQETYFFAPFTTYTFVPAIKSTLHVTILPDGTSPNCSNAGSTVFPPFKIETYTGDVAPVQLIAAGKHSVRVAGVYTVNA